MVYGGGAGGACPDMLSDPITLRTATRTEFATKPGGDGAAECGATS